LFSFARSMSKLRAAFLFCLLFRALACIHASAAEPQALTIESQGESFEFSLTNGLISLSNNVIVKYGTGVLTANRALINTNTGDIFADGSVRVQKEDQTWTGEHLHYNYLTTELDGQEFRTGRTPAFGGGEMLQGNHTNNTYTATNGFVTADDYFNPLYKVRAKSIKIVPGEYFVARNAYLYIGNVPVFYFPYYRRNLNENGNSFTFVPGYRSSFGAFLLTTYHWYLNDDVQGSIHADVREKRGFGAGPDFHLNFGDYGDALLKYYYTYDKNPALDGSSLTLPNNRQRAFFNYTGMPATNLTINAQAAWWSDPLVTHDFFESEYRKDIQPKSYFDVEQAWQNWSLDALAEPRVNGFFENVERLPEVRLTGFPQQIFDTPLYYESQSSVGWYRHRFSDTNFTMEPYSASRADTFHQITLPETFFGWLNVTPRAGGRFTSYSQAEGPGATTTEENRTVFNTGADVSTKLSRTWPGVENHLLDLDGVRHIIEPSIDYVYVPSPSVPPGKLPQFDYELTNSLYMVPIDFPDYNAIDSIDSQNVIRYGFRNRLQTKRDGQVGDFVNWGIYTDWRIKPQHGQSTFSDMFSDLELKPTKHITLTSQTRFDIRDGRFNLARHAITFQPNSVWSWTVGHYFLRNEPQFGGIGADLITSTFYYRFNDNWGARISHQFDATSGTMQEQYYTLYRDLRSWTAGLTFRIEQNVGGSRDYTVAFTFSLKAFPRFGLGQDTVNSATLIGY
jgi:LPS-assembly protein